MSLYYSAKSGGFYDESIHAKEQIPLDAVSVTVEEYQELLTAQGKGKRITADSNGNPVAIDPPTPTGEQLALAVRTKRDQLISDTDYLVMPDYPISADLLAKVKAYRQALRDIPEQVGFPADIDWPINPMDEVTA